LDFGKSIFPTWRNRRERRRKEGERKEEGERERERRRKEREKVENENLTKIGKQRKFILPASMFFFLGGGFRLLDLDIEIN
jgi:hypothetical protein